MSKQYWRIYCVVEQAWTRGWSVSEPTTCFNNAAHEVNPNSQSVVSDALLSEGSSVVLSENDISGVKNLELDGCVKISDIAEPDAPGSGSGKLYKPTGSSGLFWKSDTNDPIDLMLGSEFVGSIRQYSDEGPFSTTATDYVSGGRFNTDNMVAGFYRIAWNLLWSGTNGSKNHIKIVIDDTDILSEYILAPVTYNDQQTPISGFKYINIDAGTHYIDAYLKTSVGNKTVIISEIRMEYHRVKDQNVGNCVII